MMRRMDLAPSERAAALREDMLAFMDSHVYPAEATYERQITEGGDPHLLPPVVEELKAEARKRGLWNLFLPDEKWGAGLTNLDYAHIAEITGRSPGPGARGDQLRARPTPGTWRC